MLRDPQNAAGFVMAMVALGLAGPTITYGQYIIDWDEFPVGATSGSGSFYDWARSSGDDFLIVDDYVHTPGKSLMYWCGRSQQDDIGNIYYDFASTTPPQAIEMWLELDFSGQSGTSMAYDKHEYQFSRDGTDVLYLLVVQNNNPYYRKLVYKDVFGAEHDLYTSFGTAPTPYRIVIEHVSGNEMTYQLYSAGGSLLASATDTSLELEEWSSFDRLYIKADHWSYGGDLKCLLDDIIIHTDDSGLVGLWHCDEASGAVARDSSTRGNHATIVGAVSNPATISWDEYNVGAHSGAGAFYSWARGGGDDFEVVYDHVETPPRSLYLYSAKSGTTDDSGTVTYNFDSSNHPTKVEFWLELDFGSDYGGSAWNKVEFTVKRGSTEVLYFVFFMVAGTPDGWEKLQYHDAADTAHDLYSFNDGVTYQVRFVIEHVTGNLMKYTLYDQSGGQLASATDTSRETAAWSWFDAIYINNHHWGSYGLPIKCLVDDIIIWDSTLEEGGGSSWTTGRFGSGLEFDGVDDYLLIGDSVSLDVEGGVTIAGWVLPYSLFSRDDIFKKSGAYWFNLQDGGKLATYLTGISPSPGYYLSDSAIVMGEWTHIAFTYDGSQIRQYINGTLDTTHTGLSGTIDTSSNPLLIGYHNEDTAFHGVLDELVIFSRALSDGEVRNLLWSTHPDQPEDNTEGDQSEVSGTSNDPVNTATGSFFHQETDLSIPSRGSPLIFTRFYNSKAAAPGRKAAKSRQQAGAGRRTATSQPANTKDGERSTVAVKKHDESPAGKDQEQAPEASHAQAKTKEESK